MFWYNGKLIDSQQLQLDLSEPGLCYGATTFTTMRVYNQSLNHPLTSWQAHCDRLSQSIRVFRWQQPNWQQLRQGADLLSLHFSVLRIAVFPDGREWITGRDLPSDLKHRQTQGITAWVAADSLYRRELAEYKTGNYLSAYLARNRAREFNASEAILVDYQGNWLETSTGNLWGWRDGCWYTPSLDSGILPGIARSRLLNSFRDREIKVIENIWTSEFVKTLSALYYSNCVVEIIPIKTVLHSTNHCFKYSMANWQTGMNQIEKQTVRTSNEP
ncbi:aminotransferase class IV [Pleurocapsales cyanobacterium LEGE 10410]|nr:aminotransferase class IV [Pleurocapsales cyanobacterium LEGE 10410]